MAYLMLYLAMFYQANGLHKRLIILPGILFGIQLSTAYHARHLCYLALCIAHASADRVYGIALYLWFPNRALNVSALLQ